MKLSLLPLSIVVGALSLSLPVSAAANKFAVNVGAIGVIPADSSSSLNTVESILGLSPDSSGVAVNTNTQLGITFDYTVSEQWTMELVAATPFDHEISGSGALAGVPIGSTKHLPPTLLAQYHFDVGQYWLKPFVGVGINYTAFFDTDLSPAVQGVLIDNQVATADDDLDLALENSWGAALQAGFNAELSDNWGLHFMVSKIDIGTTGDVRLNGATIEQVDVDIDPYVAMLGLRFTF